MHISPESAVGVGGHVALAGQFATMLPPWSATAASMQALTLRNYHKAAPKLTNLGGPALSDLQRRRDLHFCIGVECFLAFL